jgi:hypothetical protein
MIHLDQLWIEKKTLNCFSPLVPVDAASATRYCSDCK